MLIVDVWIIGDSIPYWAGKRAADRGRRNLRLTHNTSIAWWGIRGMSWEDFTYSLQLDVLLRQAPKLVLIHLGGNDLTSIETKSLLKLIEDSLKYLQNAFPNCKIIWVDILQRMTWGKTHKENVQIEKKRKRINRWGKQLLGGRSIKIDIDIKTPGFYRPDGIHLSDVGLDMYLDSIKDVIIENAK